ncbi:aromatic ring-hydroxylating dioxygenase subunit alpha [Oxynema sp. CENA135]|uniref:aromatic ring-hydroxylating dioxygenase subunit alpha n=1 Tax=Oxynema sp. CENA135 TaxID=984206 RepID=UPI00190D34D6|nr:aromatic ring-hydroxylating dioxygenase subunit alpha [Oxynema sp. CENA135]MBK4730693.1 aromatic ring-hydroxylating dioxygenase subunit alpha [Oxynema sp. CENA135]
MSEIDRALHEDWHPIAALNELEKTTIQERCLLGKSLILWRDGDRVAVWENRCPHRGAKLSGATVTGDRLVCPYHGLHYDRAGQCVFIPAHPDLKPPDRLHVRSYPCQIHYDLIWVNLSKNNVPIPEFREWNDPNYRKFLCGPYVYESSGFRAIENFLDVSHFPFVHDGLLGDRDRPRVEEYTIDRDRDGLKLNNVGVWQPDPDGTGSGGRVTYDYSVSRPLTASFVKHASGGKLAIFFTVCPTAEEACVGWMWIAMNYGQNLPEAELRAFQDRVVRQDLPIVASQHPKRLPLDLKAEIHLPCDRASIAYRQWLRELNIRFGTLW